MQFIKYMWGSKLIKLAVIDYFSFISKKKITVNYDDIHIFPVSILTNTKIKIIPLHSTHAARTLKHKIQMETVLECKNLAIYIGSSALAN